MPVLKEYQALLDAGDLDPDNCQERAIELLNHLRRRLKTHEKRLTFPFFGLRQKRIKGVYLFGPVGRGKTMLMDLFYNSLTSDYKKRIHFHEFMIDVHERLNKLPNNLDHENRIEAVADQIDKDVDILCFDEFHVTDVADAMILKPLFTRLFARDVVVVSTSNWEPSNLYKDGLQRERFLPFIDLIAQEMDIFEICEGTDYRMEKLSNTNSWFAPLNNETQKAFDNLFNNLTNHTAVEPLTLTVKGHDVFVPKISGKTAWTDVENLLEKAYAAEDFLTLAERFSILFLDDVPIFKSEQHDLTKRFMLLVDTFYDKGSKLIIRADASPQGLYKSGKLAFEFERTVSRLNEMDSNDYGVSN